MTARDFYIYLFSHLADAFIQNDLIKEQQHASAITTHG